MIPRLARGTKCCALVDAVRQRNYFPPEAMSRHLYFFPSQKMAESEDSMESRLRAAIGFFFCIRCVMERLSKGRFTTTYLLLGFSARHACGPAPWMMSTMKSCDGSSLLSVAVIL